MARTRWKNTLTPQQKLKVIQQVEQGITRKDIALNNDISVSYVNVIASEIIKNKIINYRNEPTRETTT